MSNAITVGQRSDGLITIQSAPTAEGPQTGSAWVLDAKLARWLAKELLAVADRVAPTGSKDV